MLDDDCVVGPHQLGLPTLNQNEKKIATIDEGEVLFNREWQKYIKPMGYQGASMRGWYENCRTLCENYNGEIGDFFKKHDNDALKIWGALTYKPGGDSSKKEFKRIDKKLASLFLQWVGRYNLYELSNMDEFGLPVDLQLCRIAIQTGIVIPSGEIYRENLANDVLVPLIGWLCKKYNWKPRHVSEVLWLIGSGGCTSDQSSVTPYPTCPLKDFCRGVVHKIDMNYWKFSNLENMKGKVTFWNDKHRSLF